MMQFFLNHKADFNTLFNYNKTSFHLILFRFLYKTKYFDD